MTIHEAQQQLLFQLSHIYEDREAQSITDWVMEHLTGWKKIDRILNKKVKLSSPQEEELQNITEQLLAHKPVHYVLHQAWFQGMKLYVDENVLIPRPETEELVEWVIEQVGIDPQGPLWRSWSARTPVEKLVRKDSFGEVGGLEGRPLRILDVGTGSGCIPIALKKRLPETDVFACDISEGALKVAARNAAEQQAGIQLLQVDFLNEKERDKLPVFDIIVSNPPYIATHEQAEIDRHVLEYEPHVALFVPDDDSLVFYEHLARFGRSHLEPGGCMMMEIHYLKGNAVKSLFESKGYIAEVRKDMQGKDRMIKVVKS